MTRGKFLAVVCTLGLMVMAPTQPHQQIGWPARGGRGGGRAGAPQQ
jgi:hypothetical protein